MDRRLSPKLSSASALCINEGAARVNGDAKSCKDNSDTASIASVNSTARLARVSSLISVATSKFYSVRRRNRKKGSTRSGSASPYWGGTLGLPATPANQGGASPKPRRIVSKYSGRELQMEDDQCLALSESFFRIPDKYYVFEQMFLRLFRDDHEVALVFGHLGVPDLELRRRTPFRTHVCKFQRFMTTVLDLLPKAGRENELIQIVRMVGRQHCNVKQLSFTAARWLSFKNALTSAFAPSEQDKYYVPWSILIGFLIYEIKDAYLSHVEEDCKFGFGTRKKVFTTIEALNMPMPSNGSTTPRDPNIPS